MTPTLKIQNGELVPVGGKALWEDFKGKNDGEIFTLEPFKKTRTQKQNRSIRKWCSNVSKRLSDGGITVKRYFSKPIDTNFTPELVMELIWRPNQINVTGKKSSTQLETNEVTKVYEQANLETSENFFVHEPFPSNMPDEFEL